MIHYKTWDATADSRRVVGALRLENLELASDLDAAGQATNRRSDEAADLRQQLAALHKSNLALEARAVAADAAAAEMEREAAKARVAAAEAAVLFEGEDFERVWGPPDGQDSRGQACEGEEQLGAGVSEGQEERRQQEEQRQQHPEAEYWEERAVHLEERLSVLETDNARLQAQVAMAFLDCEGVRL